MSEKYKVYNSRVPHFITITVIDWIDLFTRKEMKDVLIESMEYCQTNKGLKIHAYVIMPSHVHMIVSSECNEIPGIIRDFKKYTSSRLIKTLQEINESRKEWLLEHFSRAAPGISRNKNYKAPGMECRMGFILKYWTQTKFLNRNLIICTTIL